MKAKEFLERLEAAKEIVSSFPPDTEIASVTVDGLAYTIKRDAKQGRIITYPGSLRKLAGSGDEYMGAPITREKSEAGTYERAIVSGFEIS